MIDTIADGLDHPECVATGPDGAVYAGGEAGQLYKLDAHDYRLSTIGQSGGWLLGLAVDSRGFVYACDAKRKSVLVFGSAGDPMEVSRGTALRPMVLPNYPVFDAQGNLYVSDSGVWPEGGGCIFKIDVAGATSIWSLDAPHFTNGLAIDSTGEYLYVAESTLPGITKIPIRPDGSAGTSEVVVLLPGTVPDGIAFDEAGRLYIACYRPDRVYRYSVGGALEIVRDDYQGTDLSAPTNVTFAGSDRRDLLVGSLGRWHIARIRVDVPGQPLRYPQGPTNPHVHREE